MSAIFAQPQIARKETADGRTLLWSQEPLNDHRVSVVHDFRVHADMHPERILVAERDRDGQWCRVTWGAVRCAVDRLAEGLIENGLTGRPVMILSGNSVLHLTVALAAMTAGAAVVPVSEAYSRPGRDHAYLRAMVDLVNPGVVVTDEPEGAGAAVAGPGTDRHLVLPGPGLHGETTIEDLTTTPRGAADRACAELGPETVAKILFTSGSTGRPKGVVNTHGMLAANQQQIRQVWPFVTEEPPVLLDWLPWSHTFGGNHNLNLVLSNGGTLFIDDGRPSPKLIGRTVANLADARPTIYTNVPSGWAAVLEHLERDDTAARAFLHRLRLGFFAAAALSQQVWDRIQALVNRHGSAMQMTTAWGMTETGPAALSAHFPLMHADRLGVPLPGVELALTPIAGGRRELRVRGPNITPGYHHRPDLTKSAFDAHNYLQTGDAAELADATDPAAGLVFRGRLAEDFKLATGTFVAVGVLRNRLLEAADGLVWDVVLCGEHTHRVTALAWLRSEHIDRCPSGLPDDGLRADLAAALNRLAARGGGSSQRVERIAVLTDPPDPDAGEITDKGHISQRVVRELRASAVRDLNSPEPPPEVVHLCETKGTNAG